MGVAEANSATVSSVDGRKETVRGGRWLSSGPSLSVTVRKGRGGTVRRGLLARPARHRARLGHLRERGRAEQARGKGRAGYGRCRPRNREGGMGHKGKGAGLRDKLRREGFFLFLFQSLFQIHFQKLFELV